ncbi:MAG: hypothetical protein CBD27_11000 [Rhodospirillaceae bacterium TMED167]|nr:antibiotic biosynthesis monooxygenase [Rhodospirillaceae bacterium]OUW24596.1 MAG: hypothetical protein CBD27_11000 [Rhodospirillaceae bacterium TMED167]
MSRLVNLVHVKVAEGYLDKIQDAMLANARHAVLEEKCHQFDVVVSKEDDHSFVFYEVYEDEAALDAHRETAYFQAYWKLIDELGDNIQRSARLYTLVD